MKPSSAPWHSLRVVVHFNHCENHPEGTIDANAGLKDMVSHQNLLTRRHTRIGGVHPESICESDLQSFVGREKQVLFVVGHRCLECCNDILKREAKERQHC